jgi:hypothetical protein
MAADQRRVVPATPDTTLTTPVATHRLNVRIVQVADEPPGVGTRHLGG